MTQAVQFIQHATSYYTPDGVQKFLFYDRGLEDFRTVELFGHSLDIAYDHETDQCVILACVPVKVPQAVHGHTLPELQREADGNERDLIAGTLVETHGNVSEAARKLHVKRAALVYRMDKLAMTAAA